LRVVTSFSPSRIDRQKHCLSTWIKAGCQVTAIQSPGEKDLLQGYFSGVEFKETELVGDAFGRPKLVRIKSLTDEAKEETVLILNSDIEIDVPRNIFMSKWNSVEPRTLKNGVRWQRGRFGRTKTVFKWGIDAFLITPEISRAVTDVGMTMGCPVWDYWIIWYMHTHGFAIKTDLGRCFWHENHDANWSKAEYKTGFDIMMKEYGISESFLTNFIQEVTHRKGIKR
jgi:hypothetical protein